MDFRLRTSASSVEPRAPGLRSRGSFGRAGHPSRSPASAIRPGRSLALSLRVACLLALAGVALPAAAQVPSGGAALLEEHEIERDGKIVRYVKHLGQLYRKIKPGQLRLIALPEGPLHGMRVCVEGKFSKLIDANTFQLIGSDRRFVALNRNIVVGIMHGDNIWLGGQAKRIPRAASCYMRVHHVVRLPRDLKLFNQRFAKCVQEKNWRKLLDLGEWIVVSGERARGVRLQAPGRYRVLKDKAFREAIKIRKRGLDPDDAEGWGDLARMYLELLGRAGRLPAIECLRRAYERRAVAEDSTNEKTKELFVELGYRFADGQWLPKVEYEERQAEKLRLLAVELAGGTKEGTPDGTEVEAAPSRDFTLRERIWGLLKVERTIRINSSGLVGAVERLKGEDDAVARWVVWVLANTGDISGWTLLLENVASLSAAIRGDVADALAWREDLDALDDLIREERDPEVISHAVDALASVDPQKSMDTLVSLLSFENQRTRSRVNAALRSLTGKSHSGAAAWSSWWEDNRDTFRAPAEMP